MQSVPAHKELHFPHIIFNTSLCVTGEKEVGFGLRDSQQCLWSEHWKCHSSLWDQKRHYNYILGWKENIYVCRPTVFFTISLMAFPLLFDDCIYFLLKSALAAIVTGKNLLVGLKYLWNLGHIGFAQLVEIFLDSTGYQKTYPSLVCYFRVLWNIYLLQRKC